MYEATKQKQADSSTELPADFSQSIPASGLAWLGSAGITVQSIEQYGIGYSKELNRVIIPVYYKLDYYGYIARRAEKWMQPKYLEKLYNKQPFFIPGHNLDTVVLVEDVLSCIRVGKYCNCVSLNGTSLTDSALRTIQQYKSVKIWLDPDKAGRIGTAKIKSRLFKPCTVIKSDKDPKLLTNEEIRDKLDEPGRTCTTE